MIKIKPTRLYIKKHKITGLKYFGKSVKKNLNNYHGSGKLWKRHINKHGKNFVETIWISDWFNYEEEIIKFCKTFCVENDIVNSSEWANLKEETGLDGGLLPDYALKSISSKLKGRTKETHDYIKKSSEKKSKTMKDPNSFYQKQARPKIKKWLDSLSDEERKLKLGHIVSEEQKLKLSMERKNKTKENCERVLKMSETKKLQIKNMSKEERQKKLGHSKGMKWYYNDSLKTCKTFRPENVSEGWKLGRKKYED
jgi:hypothetical protein